MSEQTNPREGGRGMEIQMYEVLEGGLAEVQKGWCQGQLEDGRGNCCALGGLERVEKRRALGYTPAFGLLREAMDGNIVAFNNSHTQEQVEDRFRAAIRSEKAKAGSSLDLPATPVAVEEKVGCRTEAEVAEVGA